LGSRRACEELIEQGRVSVNGETAKLGQKANPQTDRIAVDGKVLDAQEELVYYALYKPRGIISAVSSPDQRQTVRDLVPAKGHVYPVGRLDVDSEGLMLLTNDGELANRLTHPRFGHEKEYRVLVARQPDSGQVEAWRHGVVLEDGHRTAPAVVQIEGTFGKGAWMRVILKEGRKRQIREMGMLTGLPIVRIIRTRIGTLRVGGMKPGDWRELTPDEVGELKGKRPDKSRPKPSERRARTADRGTRSEERGQKPEARGQRSERRSPRPEDRGQRPGSRNPRSVIRTSKSEGGKPRSESRSQRPEGRGQRTGKRRERKE
jgi:23S rRNA pseudouridine2605 synthase